MIMLSRRGFCAGVASVLTIRPAAAMALTESLRPPTLLLDRAKRALDRHWRAISSRDIVGLVDFSIASRDARFFLVDLRNGAATSVLVAHGKGSDPDHSGWVERFSNLPGSQASSAGAYLTSDVYAGKHGRSRRLVGLDWDNSNAEARGIVIHAAPYVSAERASASGKIGRSEGCLAVAPDDLDYVLRVLGPGCLVYADDVLKTS